MKQSETVAFQPHVSLVVPLPVETSALLALRDTLRRLGEMPEITGSGLQEAPAFELVLVDFGHDGALILEAITDAENGAASQLYTRVISAPTPVGGAACRSADLLAAVSQTSGQYVAILDRCASAELLPSAETVASALLAAENSDLVIASRYLPGAVESTVTNSWGVRADFRQWLPRYRDKLAATACFRRLAQCTDLGSNFYVVKRGLVKDLEIPAAPREAGSPSLLLQILVRCQWTLLTETPYRDAGIAASSAAETVPSLSIATLRSLRRGPRARGPVRYRYQHLQPGPDDPEPLDDELPDVSPALAGSGRRRFLWTVAILALVLRIILLPIGHWWDITVDYNTFIDLAHNVSPYTTMQYLSHIAYASGWDYSYEYYAYPPVPLYIYYPLAHLYLLLHPQATYYIPVSGTYATPDLSLDFFVLLKFPIWIADFGIAALLARMSGTVRGFRDYLLNPYILLVSGAWTFDAIMVLGLVLAVYYLQRGKLASSGVALAFGTMVKFIPVVAAPTIVLYLIKKKRPVREIVLFVVAYGVACVVFVGPFWSGLLYVVNFEGNRVPGGMNWQMFFRLSTFFPADQNLDPLSLAVGAFGTPTLFIVLLLAYWYCFTARHMTLNRMILITLLAFLLGSKLVNEQYALVVFPFAFLEAWRVGGAWRWLARLFWIVPLLFAIVRVQIDRFLWLLYRDVWGAAAKAIAVTAKTGFNSQFLPWSNLAEEHIIIIVLAISFDLLCLVAFFWPARPSIRPCRHLQAIETLSPTSNESETILEGEAGGDPATPAPAIALQ